MADQKGPWPRHVAHIALGVRAFVSSPNGRMDVIIVENYVTTDHQICSLPSHQQIRHEKL
jgi:hypothetical protein